MEMLARLQQRSPSPHTVGRGEARVAIDVYKRVASGHGQGYTGVPAPCSRPGARDPTLGRGSRGTTATAPTKSGSERLDFRRSGRSRHTVVVDRRGSIPDRPDPRP